MCWARSCSSPAAFNLEKQHRRARLGANRRPYRLSLIHIFGIAFLYDLSLDELYALNGLQPGALLQIDQELIIGQQPTPTAAPPTTTATAAPTEAPSATPTDQPVEAGLGVAPTATATATAHATAVVAQVEPESTVAATATLAATDSQTSASSRSLMWLAIAGVVVAGAAVGLLRWAGRS